MSARHLSSRGVSRRRIAGERPTGRVRGGVRPTMTGFFSVGTFIKGAVAFVAMLATMITAVAASLYIVAPELRPREKLGASLDRLAVTQAVPYYQYAAEQGQEDIEEPIPDAPGITVLVHATLIGYQDRSYSMNVRLLDAETLQPLHIGMDQPFTSTCENKSPRADEDGVSWRCWTVSPPASSKYIVRAELFDAGPSKNLLPGPIRGYRELLDFYESPVITAAPETRDADEVPGG